MTHQTTPEFFRPLNPTELEQLNGLRKKNHPQEFDQIKGQLKELIKSLNPGKRFSEAEYDAKIKEHLKGTSIDNYGVWVYYSWSNRLVHILDEAEFKKVRTNRNQYKLTEDEQVILSTKKIGVVGLSVGQSISLTLAMERGFGELRLADFDELELSNLNRIRSGVHNLGLPKVTIAAREIAEIDPFMKVICFYEGLTEENMGAFFTGGGKLDLLVDECDGLDIKILCRYKARELGIPVIMDTSDRGMLDIERFDLEPDRPLLHGFIGNVNPAEIKGLTNEEKIPYILPMVGANAISTRLKASMMEVDQSINTWPQLASAVTLGGALGADISRRILLDQLHVSGRFYIDLEELVADTQTEVKAPYEEKDEPAPLTFDLLKANTRPEFKLVENAHSPADKELREIMNAACLAPSGGNMQPWKWVWSNSTLYLYHEKHHSYSFLDYSHFGSYIAFGAATENIKIKASEFGLAVTYLTSPDPGEENLVAVYQFEKKDTGKDILVPFIPLRVSNRKPAGRTTISTEMLTTINGELSALNNGVELRWMSDDSSLAELADVAASCEVVRMLHPRSHFDTFKKEVRWTDEEVRTTGDGIDLDTLELSDSDRAGISMATDARAINYLYNWHKGSGFKKGTSAIINNASVMGLLVAKGFDNKSFFEGGRALERVWLKATEAGLAFQPAAVSLFLFARLMHGNGAELDSHRRSELRALMKRFYEVWKLKDTDTGVFMFRLGVADAPSARSLRRPLEKVFLQLN